MSFALFGLSAQSRTTFSTLASALQHWYARTADLDGVAEDDLRRWAHRHRLVYLGAGASRVVFAVAEGALKIEFEPRMGANALEAQRWATAPPELRRLLVPVLAISRSGAWLLMERAQPGGILGERERALLAAHGIHDVSMDNTSKDGRLLDYDYVRRAHRLKLGGVAR